MNKIFEIATNISTPLMLAGFLSAVFFIVIRQIIKKNIFPKLTRQLSGDIIKLIIERLFILALIAIILGFLGYLIEQINPSIATEEKTQSHYAEPKDDLIKLILEDIDAIDFAPKPETKNLTFRFKVIPNSKDKFVPLKTKGELELIDSFGVSESYTFDANFNPEGIEPEIVSYLQLDGLIPKQKFHQLIALGSFKAVCTFYYDSDVFDTDIVFQSEKLSINKNSITDFSANQESNLRKSIETIFQNDLTKDKLISELYGDKRLIISHIESENYEDLLVLNKTKLDDITFDLAIYFHNDEMNQMGRTMLFINFYEINTNSVNWNDLDEDWENISTSLTWDIVKQNLERINGFKYSLERSTPLGTEKPHLYYLQLVGRRNELNQFDLASMQKRRERDDFSPFHRVVGTYDFMIEKFSPLIL